MALGGDIAVAGESPAGGWSVRVQDITGPLGSAPSGPTQLIGLVSGGLATSSTAARRWVRGGRVMHHILDPRTGVPVASPWRTVSVAAPTCLAANVASTAAIVRGASALDWLAGRGLAARFVDVEGAVTTLAGLARPERRAAVNTQALWYLSRATGLVSFMLLSLVVVLGATIARRGKVPGLPRFAGVGLHRNAAMFAVVLLVIHIVTAVIDPFVTIGWVSAIVPFTSRYEPIWLGLGALAIDLTVAVVVTSLLRFRVGLRVWRAVHWLAYAIWPLAAIHGIGAAADLQSGVLLDVVLATIAAVVVAIGWRFRAFRALQPSGDLDALHV